MEHFPEEIKQDLIKLISEIPQQCIGVFYTTDYVIMQS